MGKRVERLHEQKAMKKARIKKVLEHVLVILVFVLVWGAVIYGVSWALVRIKG